MYFSPFAFALQQQRMGITWTKRLGVGIWCRSIKENAFRLIQVEWIFCTLLQVGRFRELGRAKEISEISKFQKCLLICIVLHL